MLTLKDPTADKLMKPVHIDRLKVVYVRQPNPINFFVPKVVTGEKQDSPDENSSDNQSQELRDKNETPVDTNVESKYSDDVNENPNINIRRSSRIRKRPVRFREISECDSDTGDIYSPSDSSMYYKVKHFRATHN